MDPVLYTAEVTKLEVLAAGHYALTATVKSGESAVAMAFSGMVPAELASSLKLGDMITVTLAASAT